MPCGEELHLINCEEEGKAFQLDLHLWVILGLHSDWVLVHILRTSLIVQSWEQNRLEKEMAFSKSSQKQKRIYLLTLTPLKDASVAILLKQHSETDSDKIWTQTLSHPTVHEIILSTKTLNALKIDDKYPRTGLKYCE